MACDGRRPPQFVTALLRAGADPARRSAGGETPLRICVLSDPAAGALPEAPATTAVVREALLLVAQRYETAMLRTRLTRQLWLEVAPFLPRSS